ncbi:MAG TPA: hypothetical protein PLP05_12600 [Sedimentisphaerales bacterium]|nr:hypothetical protein [Sedimentisphaerales bacterium]
MTKAKITAIKLRKLLLTLWILCLIGGLIWLLFYIGLAGAPEIAICGPLSWNIECINDGWGYFAFVLIYTAFFFFTQWLFLAPRKLWKSKTRITARPMKKAAIAAAFAIALLSAGFIYSILSLFSIELKDTPSNLSQYLFASIPLILWLFWSIIFCIYFRQNDYYSWAGKIIRGLIAGSILELFVSIPIFITREDDCYCARGSYAGLIFGATALLWAFGPAVFLLFLKQKHQIEKLDT